MGQRLVVDIIKDGRRIANVYFHNSASMETAFIELIKLRDILLAQNKMKGLKEIPDLRLRLIKGLEKTGGGISCYGTAYVMWPQEKFEKDVNRNQGLVEISEEGMDNAEAAADGVDILDLDTMAATNTEYWCFADFQEWIREMEIPKEGIPDEKVIPTIKTNLPVISLNKLEEAYREYTHKIQKSPYGLFYVPGGSLCQEIV